jgi:hypothetical protein
LGIFLNPLHAYFTVDLGSFIVSTYTCECLCDMELNSWSDRSYVFPGRL